MLIADILTGKYGDVLRVLSLKTMPIPSLVKIFPPYFLGYNCNRDFFLDNVTLESYFNIIHIWHDFFVPKLIFTFIILILEEKRHF